LFTPLLLNLLLSVPLTQNGGVEDLLARLEAKFATERAQAASVWTEHGPAYLANPSQETVAPILAQAPFIQEPLLADLFDLSSTSAIRKPLLKALIQCMDSSGADSLAANIHDLTPSELSICFPALLQKNSFLAEWTIRSYLEHEDADLRFLALENLLLFGSAPSCPAWVKRLDLGDSPPIRLGQLLLSLSDRQDLPSLFEVPEAFFAAHHDDVVHGTLSLLLAFPSKGAEEFAQEIALDLTRPALIRTLAVQVIEKSTPLFRWRRSQREFTYFLKSHSKDPLAIPIAWTAHRLGEKSATKFLSKDLKDAVRKNPKDWRLRLDYGKRLVELSEFSDAYKEYRNIVQDLEGTPAYRSIPRESWLFAARAACGARRMSDGADWLSNARMSPRELETYKNLPEFKAALSKPAFKKLFGLR